MRNNSLCPPVAALGFVLSAVASSVFAEDGTFEPVSPLQFDGTITLSSDSFVANPEVPAFHCDEGEFSSLSDEERLNRMFNSVVVVSSWFSSGMGTGFIIDSDQGYIVTNEHVVENFWGIKVNLYDPSMPDHVGRVLNAELIGEDKETDIAVLKVDPTHLSSCAIISEEDVDYLDHVVGIGHPFTREFSTTTGVVSHPARYDGFYPFIQSDALINFGHSGGPLFNSMGEVVGVNVGIVTPRNNGSSGVSLTIPIDRAYYVATDLIRYGEVRKPWIGLQVRDATYSERDDYGLTAGATFIRKIEPQSPTERAGLLIDDLVTHVNGVEIPNMLQMFNFLQAGDPGDRFEVTYLRDGEEYTTIIVSESHEEYLARIEDSQQNAIQQATTGQMLQLQ